MCSYLKVSLCMFNKFLYLVQIFIKQINKSLEIYKEFKTTLSQSHLADLEILNIFLLFTRRILTTWSVLITPREEGKFVALLLYNEIELSAYACKL